jgi:hypothetical protein
MELEWGEVLGVGLVAVLAKGMALLMVLELAHTLAAGKASEWELLMVLGWECMLGVELAWEREQEWAFELATLTVVVLEVGLGFQLVLELAQTLVQVLEVELELLMVVGLECTWGVELEVVLDKKLGEALECE